MNRAWIELDEAALEHNIRRYQRLLPAGCEIMGVVKADAYGHGAKAVARSLEKWGIRHFATATLDEAVKLLAEGKTCRVVAMDGEDIVDYDITEALAMTKGLDARGQAVTRAMTGVSGNENS